jgi:hypothetical protein
MSKVNGDLLVQGFHLNLKPEQLATDPTIEDLGSSPRIWGNSTDGKLKYHNGTEVLDLTALGLTEDDLTAALAPFAKTADLPAPVDISGLATKTELTDAVADLVSETDLTTATQNLVSATAMQNAIDNALAGLDFQADVLGTEADFVDQAGRYIYTDGSKFTTGVAAEVNDIVEVSATGEITSVAYDVSAAGPGALTWNRAAPNGGAWYRWNGSDWDVFGGLSGVSAGNGLQDDAGTLSVKAANSSIVVDANGVKVGDLSATYVTPAALATELNAYATDAELTDAVAGLVSETSLASELADYAKTADLPAPVDISGLATKTELGDYVKTADLPAPVDISGLATKVELEDYVKTEDLPAPVDVSGFATTASVETLDEKVDALVTRIEASEFQFTPQAAGTTITVTHNFGNKYPIVQVVDTDDTVIGVEEVKFVDENSLTVKLAVAGTPKVIVQGLKSAAQPA